MPATGKPKINVSVVIPVFNGIELLKRYLPSVLAACENYGQGETEVIIVDDAGTDGTAGFLNGAFPSVKIVRHTANQGFSATANDGILSARHGIVVLLNNDVEVSPDFLGFVPQRFEDTEVFAVRPGLTDSSVDDTIKDPKIGGRFNLGYFAVPESACAGAQFAFFSGGGASAYSREKFLELGGFDEMFAPFYVEDVDLSYRAWKRGWKIVYEPRCRAWHQGGATITKFHKEIYVSAIIERNKFLLVWKNVTDPLLLLNHFFFAPLRMAYWYLKGVSAPVKGLLLAMRLLPEVMEKRSFEKLLMKKSDRDILKLFKA